MHIKTRTSVNFKSSSNYREGVQQLPSQIKTGSNSFNSL